ncbi:1-(5-phosphoribosyl)-5-[(5-phosphoribosylamino)methylideneamino]imidazole-4-carboxamide isomerase [Candidatus Bathyarchaeota archaeon]|nr:1-(5-phosphoribosyl)-5-[(5-phosphoribosylamino)methylideneamino]imidazole-4-carboxamide isomerase [Candidatus Bathyarchaeota archaeon]
MKIFPAIDLMDGKVVRLLKGDPEAAKIYDWLGKPVEVAKKWEKDGADALHVIDLDAALNRGNNFATISEIVQAVKIPVHVGGGIRSEEAAEKLLSIGVDKVMLGTLAFKKPEAIKYLIEKFGDCIIVALDYDENGRVMIEGWRKEAELSVAEAMKKFLKLKVKTFLLTSISRDGTLKGVSINIVKRICALQKARIIAAGGVSSLNDLAILKQAGVYGVVIGKALYEGVFTLKEALELAR